MKPLEEVQEAIKQFEKTQRDYSKFGAYDTEPSAEWQYAIIRSILGNSILIPENWDLYDTSMDCKEATEAINKSAKESLKVILKHSKDKVILEYLNTYCWRITLYHGDFI